MPGIHGFFCPITIMPSLAAGNHVFTARKTLMAGTGSTHDEGSVTFLSHFGFVAFGRAPE